MGIIFAVLMGLFLAYANGANDNFKGVATLYGSRTSNFKFSLRLATAAQILGSLVALFLAQGLLAKFSGKGLVPDAVVAMKSFSLSVGLAAAATVMLATWLGFPISTTHALTGALVGAGMLASAEGVNFNKLGSTFFAPLILSPILAVVLGSIVYLAFKQVRKTLEVEKENCLCVGTEVVQIVPMGTTSEQALTMYSGVIELPSMTMGTQPECIERYTGRMIGVSVRSVLDAGHYLSAGAVCFARALNDTPKIAATFLIGQVVSPSFAIGMATVAMMGGGLLNSRKIAQTMSMNVTRMNPGQGFSANIVTSVLVIFASKLALPVSTTHVSCGTLFGIGAVTGQAKWKTILQILFAWVTTLPIAAALGALLFLTMKQFVV